MLRRPIRVLELRSVRGTGGGPEKTILLGAARSNPDHVAVTVCYIRDERDPVFALDALAARLGVDYLEVTERHSFDRAVWPALRRVVRERQIDIVHAHDYKTDLLTWPLARAERVTPLSTVHGWSGFSRRETLLYYPADRWILRKYPRVIAVSGAIRQRLVESGLRSERVTTVPNGIDADVFRRRHEHDAEARAAFGLPPDTPVVAAVGRLEREKRYDVLIEALAALRRNGTDAKLLFAGKGSLEPSLRALAGSLGLTAACVFAGHCADVKDVFHAADVFAQSSDTEGTPNAVLEAMALETPIVATGVGGTGDLVTHDAHGLLVPRRDPPALAAAIDRTLADRGATARRVEAARRRVEDELSFARRMQTVERIYDELAEGAGPSSGDIVPWVPVREKR